MSSKPRTGAGGCSPRVWGPQHSLRFCPVSCELLPRAPSSRLLYLFPAGVQASPASVAPWGPLPVRQLAGAVAQSL